MKQGYLHASHLVSPGIELVVTPPQINLVLDLTILVVVLDKARRREKRAIRKSSLAPDFNQRGRCQVQAITRGMHTIRSTMTCPSHRVQRADNGCFSPRGPGENTFFRVRCETKKLQNFWSDIISKATNDVPRLNTSRTFIKLPQTFKRTYYCTCMSSSSGGFDAPQKVLT